MNTADHRARRRRLLTQWEDGIAIIPTNSVQRRNADSDFPFRTDSDFYYLTGFDEPESILVLCPGRQEGEELLFLRPKDPERETWDGRRLGVELAPETLGVDQAFDRAQFGPMLAELLAGRRELHFRFGWNPELDREVLDAVHRLRFKPRQRFGAPEVIRDPGTAIHEMRLFKEPAELDLMRRAAEITAAGHAAAARGARDASHEYEIQAALEYEFRRHGAEGPAYGSIVAAGCNATILHYVENDGPVRGDELLLIDAGAEFQYYAADLTRTYPVSGRFTTPQRQVYELVLAAQRAALEQVRPDVAFDAFHEAVVDTLVDGFLDFGWLAGSKEEILESGAYRRFYMHKSGHWLGLDVHDAGRYFDQGTENRALTPGMVLTVEPGIYIGEQDETVPEQFRGIGVRIEDDVLVTAEGHEVLTPQVPKEPAELEAWMKR